MGLYIGVVQNISLKTHRDVFPSASAAIEITISVLSCGVRKSFPSVGVLLASTHVRTGSASSAEAVVDTCKQGKNRAPVHFVRHRSLSVVPPGLKPRSSTRGPVMVKLRFERLKPRQSGEGFLLVAEEADLEVHASEGLEILKFQVRQDDFA